jgi:hypothetical protein
LRPTSRRQLALPDEKKQIKNFSYRHWILSKNFLSIDNKGLEQART